MAGERTIRIKIDGDGKGLIVTVRTVEKELERFAKRVDDVNKRVASGARGLAKFALAASALSSTTSGLAGLGATLTTATGALAGLPAIAAGAGAALGTIALGSNGIVRAFKGVNDTLIPLQGQVSATFEAGLKPAVDNLNTLLPQTASGFQAIAREMSGVAVAATKTLTLPQNTRDLNEVLNQTAGFMGGVRRAAGPLTNALVDVVAVGSEGFTAMGGRLAASSREFEGFIEQARRSGQLRAWIDNGVGALKQLWQTLKDIGAIVKGVFSGLAEGAGGIGSAFQPAIKAMRDFVESTRGQAFLRQVGAALAEIGEAVGGVLHAGLNAVAPMIGPLAQAFATLATTAAGILVPALNVLAPILEVIGNFMAENEGFVRVLVTALGGLAVAYLSVQVAIKLVNQATTLWSTVAGIAGQRTAALGTSFSTMGKAAKIASLSMGAIGVILAVAGAAMSLFGGSSGEAAARQEELATRARTVADAIRDQNGVIDENIRLIAAKNLEELGALDYANRIGLSKARLVDALLGEGNAYGDVMAQLKRYVQVGHSGSNADRARGVYAGHLIKILEQEVPALEDAVSATDREKEATEGSTTATEKKTAAVRRQIDALVKQIDLLREAAGITLTAREAENRWHEAVAQATQAIEDNGQTLDVHTEKGRNNRAALDNVVEATFAHIRGQAEQGASTEQLGRIMESGRAVFIRTATQMGLNEKQAKELADQLGLIPGSVRTDVKVYAKGALGTLAQTLAAVANLDGSVAVVTVATRMIGASLNDFAKKIASGFGGGRAVGGPVVGGQTYVVGERGPELFRAPNSGGHIVPNRDLAGAGGDTVVYVTIDGEQLQGRITKTVRENARQTRRAALAGTGAGR